MDFRTTILKISLRLVTIINDFVLVHGNET